MNETAIEYPEVEAALSEADLKRFFAALAASLSARIAAAWSSRAGTIRALADGFVESATVDIARWSGMLSAGIISAQDYQWLVRGRSDVAEITALSTAGLTRSQVDRFRTMLVETIVATALAELLGQVNQD
ncbi:MAG: hypothetical protein HKN29_03265 [Rhodothermales bacterium]|nr:hypothetical protein [Rhodothermales bacterium]